MVKKGRKKSMRTTREIIRLHFEHNLSQRAIARACVVSPTTVGDYLERIKQSGLELAVIAVLDDSSLKTVLYPEGQSPSRKALPDFDHLRLKMKKKGVTLQLLWEEYRSIHHAGYSRSQFCKLYNKPVLFDTEQEQRCRFRTQTTDWRQLSSSMAPQT